MFGLPGGPELLIVAFVALLLFGKRLPEVARGLGKGIVEFKKGLRGIEEEVERSSSYSSSNYSGDSASNRPAPSTPSVETTAPKFQPPTSEPT